MDHDGLLDRLTSQVSGASKVSVSSCLLACEQSNVVVVTPGSTGRRSGGRPVWLGGVLDATVVDAIAAWVNRGGPGLAALPGSLAAHEMSPPHGVLTTLAAGQGGPA